MAFSRFLLTSLLATTFCAAAWAEPRLKDSDLLGGYLVAREVGSDHVIQARLKKVKGQDGFQITQLMEGSRSQPPQVICTGSAGLSETQLSFFFTCGEDDYGSRTNLPPGKLSLKKGIPVTFNNRQYIVKKVANPYFIVKKTQR